MTDEQGRTVGVNGVSRDVTEHHDAARALLAQNEALAQSVADLERFNRITIGRELAMIDLKRRMNALARRHGEHPPYPDAAADDAGDADA